MSFVGVGNPVAYEAVSFALGMAVNGAVLSNVDFSLATGNEYWDHFLWGINARHREVSAIPGGTTAVDVSISYMTPVGNMHTIDDEILPISSIVLATIMTDVLITNIIRVSADDSPKIILSNSYRVEPEILPSTLVLSDAKTDTASVGSNNTCVPAYCNSVPSLNDINYQSLLTTSVIASLLQGGFSFKLLEEGSDD